jgi:hypothetical protein
MALIFGNLNLDLITSEIDNDLDIKVTNNVEEFKKLSLNYDILISTIKRRFNIPKFILFPKTKEDYKFIPEYINLIKKLKFQY